MVEKVPENEIPLLSFTNFVLHDEKLKKKNDRKGFQKKRFIYSLLLISTNLLMAKNWRKKNGGRET